MLVLMECHYECTKLKRLYHVEIYYIIYNTNMETIITIVIFLY